ncbi:deaminase domain-containing protein [Pseudomonas entomophila]|uniref:deaminase domain-containing protein n=1 Tax=Pseudomonas entomophila TaxID=312306 RepID=UPI00200F9CBF|nr:deaminase domain-containing protein [Pseudomonas entomophila]
MSRRSNLNAAEKAKILALTPADVIVTSELSGLRDIATSLSDHFDQAFSMDALYPRALMDMELMTALDTALGSEHARQYLNRFLGRELSLPANLNECALFYGTLAEQLIKAADIGRSPELQPDPHLDTPYAVASFAQALWHQYPRLRRADAYLAATLLLRGKLRATHPRPWQPALELDDHLDLPVLANHLLKATPGQHLFEKLLNELQAAFYYQGLHYRFPTARERKAGKPANQHGRITLDGSALNAPAGEVLDALLGAIPFDRLGQRLAAAAQWDSTPANAPMYRVLAEQTLIDALYPAAKRRPGHILDFELFNAHNKYQHLSDLRLDLINSLHLHLGGVPAMAELAAELLLRRFAPELLIDDDPDDYLYDHDVRWANLRQGAYLLLAQRKPLTFAAAEQATDLPDQQETPVFEEALAATVAEWAQLQGVLKQSPPWSKAQWQLAYDHYLTAWDRESLRDLPDRFELARHELRQVGIAPQDRNVDNQLHLNAYLDHGAGYRHSTLPDATARYDHEFQAWRQRAQMTYGDIMQRLLRHLPQTDQDRLKNSDWHCHAVTWPAYIGPVKGGVPSYGDSPIADWRAETGTQGIIVHLSGDTVDTLYELFPEKLTWRRHLLTGTQRERWSDALNFDYHDYNETDIPWQVAPWPKTVELSKAPTEHRLEALIRCYADSIALGNCDALYSSGKGTTPHEHFLAERRMDSTGRYLFKLFSNLVPGLGCFGVRNGTEALSCGLDALGTLGSAFALGGRIIKPLARLYGAAGRNASALRLGMLRAARHWKGQLLPTKLHRHGAGPSGWPGSTAPSARAKLTAAIPQDKLLPGQKPDVIRLLLGEGDDITRAWEKASNPVVYPVFIIRDPDHVDAIVNGIAYRHRIGQPAGVAQRVRQTPLLWAQDPVRQPPPYPDAPAQGIALQLAPATNQAGTPAYGQQVSHAFETIRIEPQPITYRVNGANSDSVAQVMVRENRLVQYTQEVIPGRGRQPASNRMVLTPLSDDEADAMGLLNPPHYYDEGVLGYPVSEHWFGLPADMTADQVALFTGHCPPVRLGRLTQGLADRRTLRGARVEYLDRDWLLVEADTGVFYGAPFDFEAWQHSQTAALRQGTLTPTQYPTPAQHTRLTFTRVTDLDAIAQYLDISETYRIVAARPNLQQDIDNLADLLRDWVRYQRRSNPPSGPTALQSVLDQMEEAQYPQFARNILTSPRAQDGLAGFSLNDVVGLNKQIIPDFHNLARFDAVEQLHVNGVLNLLLPASGTRAGYTPMTVAQMLTDNGMNQLRQHLSGANFAFATVTLRNGNRRVYFALSGGRARQRIMVQPPAPGQHPPIDYIDARARMQGLDPDPRFTHLTVLRRANFLTIRNHRRHLDSERLIASTINQDLLNLPDDVTSIRVFTLMDTCRSCGGFVLPRLRLDYPNADFSVSWLLPYNNN